MKHLSNNLSGTDFKHLAYCLALAEEAVKAGDKPFGSILVDKNNKVIAEARNRVNELNNLAHPEYELAAWAVQHLSASERRETTMYTSGEHCPMCAAAHGWVGLGRIVYLSSGEQLNQWLSEWNAPPSPILYVPIQQLIRNIEVSGPAGGELLEGIKSLQYAYYHKS